MIKAKASKANAGDQIASKPQLTTVRQAAIGAVNQRRRSRRLPRLPSRSKIGKIIAMMRRPNGATIDDLTKATAWQAHSVRGAMSRTLRKKQGLNVVSEKSGDVRLYRIADKAAG